jgi:hypothetical protein
MPTAKKPTASPPRASSLDTLFSASPVSHHFPPAHIRNLSITARFCRRPPSRTGARASVQYPSHLRHLYAASQLRRRPHPRRRGCKPGPSLRSLAVPALERAAARPRRAGTTLGWKRTPPFPGKRWGRGQASCPTSAQPALREKLPSPGKKEPTVRASRGALPLTERQRWGLGTPPGSPAMAAPPPPLQPPLPPLSRSPHSLSTAPDRLLKSGRIAARPLATIALASAGPDGTSERDWLARRLFFTSAHDWLLRAPHREDHSPSSCLQPFSSVPRLQVSIRMGGERERAPAGREQPIGARKEGLEVGAATRAGESSANERATHIPGSSAPSPAARVPAGRAQGHARLPVAREGCPLEWCGARGEAGAGAPGTAIVACSRIAYVEPGSLFQATGESDRPLRELPAWLGSVSRTIARKTPGSFSGCPVQ